MTAECLGFLMTKYTRLSKGFSDRSESAFSLIRRCNQLYRDLYARELSLNALTRQQHAVLSAVDRNNGLNQTDLATETGIDRSTLAEMIPRMVDKNLLLRERTDEDKRANAVTISVAGRKALRKANLAAERAERYLLEPIPSADRHNFIKALGQIAHAAKHFKRLPR